MGNIGDGIGTTNPSVGDAGTAYASNLKAILAEVLVRLTKRIPLASLAAGAVGELLDLNNIGLANAQYLQMYAQAGAPAGAPFGRLASYAGNLYYVDSGGAVQITDGGTLNASALAGITGDYGVAGNPARLNFVDATETYTFWDNMSLTQYATIAAKGLTLVDESSGESVNIVPSPAGLATYQLVLPPQPPGAATVSMLAMDDAGQVDLAEEIGPITNQFSVAGGVMHDDQVQWHPAVDFFATVVSGSPTAGVVGEYSGSAPYVLRVFLPAPPIGRRLKAVAVRELMGSTLTPTCTVQIKRVDDGVLTNTGTPGSSSLQGSAQTVTATASTVVVAPRFYAVDITFTTTGTYTVDTVYAIGITYDYVP